MRKFINPIPNGGAPLHADRLSVELGIEIWDAMQSIMARYNAETEGVIMSGCVLSANGGNFDMTAGLVYLNGVFMRVPAVTNQTFTKYIAPVTAVYVQKEFQDGIVKDLVIEETASVQGSIPGAGQYITIGSLTAARRFENVGKYDTIQFLIDGGGTTIATGQQGFQVVPFDCEIVGVEMYAAQSGSIVVDLWRDTYANFPAVIGDSFVAAAKPTISATVKSQDTTLTGWDKILTRGQHIAYNVDSVTTITRVTVVLTVKRLF